MNFLNKLGANVRNHMSTIENNFVDQARQAFPPAQKQSRIPQFVRETAVETPKPAAPVAPAATATPVKPASAAAKPPIVDIPKVLPKKEPVAVKPSETDQREKPAVKPTAPPMNSQIPPRPATEHADRVQSAFPKNGVQPGTKPNTPVKPVTPGKPFTPAQNNFNRNNIIPQPGTRPAPRPNQSSSQPGSQPGNQPANAMAQNRNQAPAQNRPAQYPGRRNETSNAPRKPGEQFAPRNNAAPGKPPFNQQKPKSAAGQGFNNGRNNSRDGGRFQKENPIRRGPIPAPRPVKPQGPITSVKSVQLPDSMTVKDFSQLIEVPTADVIKKLIGLGVMATINQEIDRDTMTLIANEYMITATAAQTEEQKLQVEEIEDDPASLVHRPPIVTILGHVDHGKTSLLDAIREANVTASEAGGITQHIGAYQVELNDRKITFLDTPGHEAFTAMRARGAQVTDIAVLVVAADDGVMPQTIEALNHAKDANVSIIVAINKIDKPGANPDRIKQDLTEYGLVAEEWGGDTIFVPVSAKKRIGIENLLEMILLVADMKDFKANPNRAARGTIIEAFLDKGHGPVATVLVQTGTLEMGDSIIAGVAVGRVRALINDKGKRVKKGGPSTPLEVIGFNELPDAGDTLHVITEDRMARELADKRSQFKRESELKKNQKITLDDLFTKIKEGEIKDLKLIIKADVHGSVEAIRQSLERLSNNEVRVKVIHGGVGGIGEGDVMLAAASNAIIIGFNVRPDPLAKRTAEKENVDIRLYRIIYNIIEDVQKAMEGMLAPEYKEVINGRAEIRMVYKVPKVGNVAGCFVLEGKISRNNEIRLIRDNIVIFEGKIDSLKRFKDDAREVLEGFECGIGIEKFSDIKEGDVIEAYSMEEIKRVAVK
jgi:translation initiation factor IF-2